jgi:hypothetical protein
MSNFLKEDKFFMKDFIPEKVICKNKPEKSFDLSIIDDGINLNISYKTESDCRNGIYSLLIPKYIHKNNKTFEVLGLLQAEMGKKHDGKISFANHEYQIINNVIKWFENEFNFKKEIWKWYIKVNINEPFDENYKKELEGKIINYWIEKSGLSIEMSYPKKVSYIKNTKNKKLEMNDYGTLIIEKGSNLFSQIIKKLLKEIIKEMINFSDNEIRSFLRGIIAGESCVEIHLPSKKYRVHISVTNPDEKLIYYKSLKKIDINSIIYKYDKLVISRKENHIKLFQQDLMSLSPEKYNKFIEMLKQYQDFDVRNI